MTLPDVRRLLQIVFAPEPPKQRERQAISLSEWRQRRNCIASVCHTETRKRMLRDTG
jgi:hypothetical protein